MNALNHCGFYRCQISALFLFCAIIGGCATGTEDSTDSESAVSSTSERPKDQHRTSAGMSAEALRLQVPYQSVTALKATDKPARINYGDAEQNYLLYRKASGQAQGTLIFVHGGCWSNRFDLQHAESFSQNTAEAGYDVWSVEYRRTGDPGGGWPGSLIDIVAAVDRVHRDAPIEPVVLAGHSAGGHLALLAGADRPEKVDAVIGLAAIARLARYGEAPGSCQAMVPRFMNGTPSERPSDYQSANPANVKLHPKTQLLQGTADNIVPVEQTRISGATVRLVEGAGHFDWLHYQSEAFHLFHRTLKEITSDLDR